MEKSPPKGVVPAARSRPYLPIPSLLLCAIAACEIFLATRRYWFAAGLLDAHGTVMRWVCWASAAALILLTLSGRARREAVDHLERTGLQSPSRHAAWLGLAYLGIFSLLLFFKYCQHLGGQLFLDSAATGNLAYNFLHQRSLECTVLGVSNYLSIHFMPAVALWSIPLLLHNSILPLLVLQTLLVASAPIAVYLLAWQRARSSLAAWAALWLVFTSGFFWQLAGACVVPQAIFFALFLWAAYFAQARRRWLVAVLAVVAALTVEEAAVVLFGLGVYALLKHGWRTKRGWAAGIGTCLGAGLLWLIERRIIASFPEAWPSAYWPQLFGHLAPTAGGLLRRVATDPFPLLRQIIWPPSNFWTAGQALWSSAGLCLLAPVELVVWAVNYLPHFLAPAGSGYHELGLHNASYCVGPLWWALGLGAASACRRLSARGWQALLPAAALGFGILNLWNGPAGSPPSGWPGMFRDEARAMAARIPPDASVWAYEPTAPWLGCRSFLKVIPIRADAAYFISRAFVPDYVLLGKTMLSRSMSPESRDRFLTFFAREGYVKVADSLYLALLKHPRAPLAAGGGRPPPLLRFEAGPQAAGYQNYIDTFSSPAEEMGLLRPAAESGEAEAQHYLGVFYSLGGLKDMAEAAKWFRKAAEQGNAPDQYNLGMCLGTGDGVARDDAQALFWLRRAAGQGFPEAARMLARFTSAPPAGADRPLSQ